MSNPARYNSLLGTTGSSGNGKNVSANVAVINHCYFSGSGFGSTDPGGSRRGLVDIEKTVEVTNGGSEVWPEDSRGAWLPEAANPSNPWSSTATYRTISTDRFIPVDLSDPGVSATIELDESTAVDGQVIIVQVVNGLTAPAKTVTIQGANTSTVEPGVSSPLGNSAAPVCGAWRYSAAADVWFNIWMGAAFP